MHSSRIDQRRNALTRLLRRGDRLTTQGHAASQRFSRWRLAIFLLGALTCIGLYQHAWFPQWQYRAFDISQYFFLPRVGFTND